MVVSGSPKVLLMDKYRIAVFKDSNWPRFSSQMVQVLEMAL